MTEESEYLSTGLASLNAVVEGGGFRPGSVVAVRAPARSVGRRLVLNLPGERPVHYVAVGHDPARYVPRIETAADVPTGGISTASIPLSDAGTALADHLDDCEDLPAGVTVVVDPVTPVEEAGRTAVSEALASLRGVLDDHEGTGVVLAATDEGRPTPPGRRVTLSRADAVLSVVHESDEDGVRHHLAVDRLPMGQRFREEGISRTFELPMRTDMTLDTSKTLSP
jgi:hypothetical protein